jgi:hypothetical protein
MQKVCSYFLSGLLQGEIFVLGKRVALMSYMCFLFCEGGYLKEEAN